jgi:hypothetical protein
VKKPDDYTPLDHLAFLVSSIHDGLLAPEHRADLEKSGLTPDTISVQKIRTIPPSLINQLAGFTVPAAVTSAYLIPYHDPAGQLMPHIRMKVFPPITEGDGPTLKYLQPPRSGVRVFFALATLRAVIDSDAPLWLIEGEKKCLAVAQQGLPAVGIAGINAWTTRGAGRLHSDFDHIPLMGRVVELVPDSDWQTHPRVRSAVGALATALAGRGAKPRVVVLPDTARA